MGFYPIILSGGAGSRLWPESRADRPKPLLTLFGTHTLLQQTLLRLPAEGVEPPTVICNAAYAGQAAADCGAAGLKIRGILAEPVPRGTAAALALAACDVLAEDKDGVLFLLPADGRVEDEAAWRSALPEALRLAKEGAFVVFGVAPGHPETGFGYIVPSARDRGRIDHFVEKPPPAEAEALVKSGALWNAGMFCVRADLVAALLGRAHPGLWEKVCAAHAAGTTTPGLRVAGAAFGEAVSDSIDRAIAARLPPGEGVVIALPPCGWSDIGSWQSVHAAAAKDAGGNAAQGNPVLVGCRDSIVRANGRTVIAVGLEGMAVVVDGDCVYVGPLSRSQELRQAVEKLGADASLKRR